MPSLRPFFAIGLSALALLACPRKPDVPPRPSPTNASVRWTQPDSGPNDPLWGVADLHAHPAIHLAFRGGSTRPGLIWGDAGTVATWPGDLPDTPACDPETHSAELRDQVTRAGRGQVLALLTETTHYPHTPSGGPHQLGASESTYDNWPNGRDLYHNAMHIQSLRRAYEGGLRLMFASTTDSQTLGEILSGSVFPGPSRTTIAKERELAEAQLIAIQRMVNANSDWMQLCATPEQAESAIRSNRLAVVPALEMDALAIDDIEDLVRRYGVGSVIPIHLIDNAIGGTAAFNDVFNANSALMGHLFDTPGRYISVEPDPQLRFHFGYPLKLGVSGIAYAVSHLDHELEAALHYTQHPLCTLASTGMPGELGHRNTVGLRDAAAIRRLMKLGVMVDVAHMSQRAVADAIDVARNFCDYPLIDTHTGVRSPSQIAVNERSLHEDHARWLADHGGVIGVGTEGRIARTRCSDGLAAPIPTGSARGGPLLKFAGARSEPGIALFPDGNRACGEPLPAGLTQARLQLATGTLTGPLGFVSVTDATGHQQQVALDGGPVPVILAANTTRIEVGLLDPATCQAPDFPNPLSLSSFTFVEPTLAITSAVLHATLPDGGAFTRDLAVPPVTLRPARHGYPLYDRCESKSSVGTCDLARPLDPERADDVRSVPRERTHVRLRIRSGAHPLKSASSLRTGALITGAWCIASGSERCPAAATACADGPSHFTITSAGGWPAAFEFTKYVALDPGIEPEHINGVALCVRQRDLEPEKWEVDEVAVEEVNDPVLAWTQDYAKIQRTLFDAGAGDFPPEASFALGTDFNGLYPQFHFSNHLVGYENADGCGATDAGASFGDDSSGGTLTLARPLRIGTQQLCFDERGLATYGMLPELFATVHHYDPKVYRSMFRSAWATIVAWKKARAAAACP